MVIKIGSPGSGTRVFHAIERAKALLAAIREDFPDVMAVEFSFNDRPIVVKMDSDIQELTREFFAA